MAIRGIADGAASLAAAVAALAVTLPPVWFTHVAIRADLAPLWGYVPAGLLAIVGIIMGAAFVRKASNGIAPSQDHRR